MDAADDAYRRPSSPGSGRVKPRWQVQPLRDRPLQRGTRLAVGLVLYGVALALLVRAELGVDPWTVLAQGLSRVTSISLGLMTVLVSLGVLALWVPLRQRPGVGTVANALVVGVVLDGTLAVVPGVDALAARCALLVAAVVGVAVATGLYVGAGWGPGARDGLMTGLAARGVPVLVARGAIELTVLGVGWLLGGDVGVGTVLYAVTIGPLVARALPPLTMPGDPVAGRAPASSG